MEKRIIINADDLALSESVNRGIMEGLRDGIITSTSIMACGTAFDHAVAALRDHNIQTIGLHLVLDEEVPVSPAHLISSIVSSDGRFLARNVLLKKVMMPRGIDLDHVRNELRAQASKCVDAGLKFSHFDGHGHVHVFPKIRNVVVEVAKEFGISKVRMPTESLFFRADQSSSLKKSVIRNVVTTFGAMSKKKFSNANLTMPDTFFGTTYGGNLTHQRLMQLLQMAGDNCVTEIMCHPGYHDEQGLSKYQYWEYNWQTELESLMTMSKKDTEEKFHCKLISYADL